MIMTRQEAQDQINQYAHLFVNVKNQKQFHFDGNEYLSTGVALVKTNQLDESTYEPIVYFQPVNYGRTTETISKTIGELLELFQ